MRYGSKGQSNRESGKLGQFSPSIIKDRGRLEATKRLPLLKRTTPSRLREYQTWRIKGQITSSNWGVEPPR